MKPYVKPELYFESFELAQHIAACAWDMKNNNDGNSCTAEWDTTDFGGVIEGQLFNYDNNACGIKDKDVGNICYTNSEPNYRVFNS
ncbi:MAG: hypothetical protein SPH42_04335 [Gemmiger sp.]|uniref:hypothetical protein n=1 Tax=Gemmiger sp. TaxID=2049027 RepID=UPI002A91A078|nr:hypothetical protein [Gemmiger sp.]MDY5326071.1 hypothetical protein [Gemmiger sp.]